MRVSIKDIAKQAGVSHSTVSRALADHPVIPEPTRRRIQRLARKLHYTPNAIARGLVTQHTHAIGVIVTSIADPFVGEVVRGIEQIAGDHHYRVFLGTSHNDPTREVNLVRAMREWRVDGVIVASSRVGSLYKPMLKEIGVPIVLINNQHSGTYIHSVGVDDALGAEIATRYLISLGHKVIGHIGGPSEHLASQNRIAGYRRGLAKAGIAPNSALIVAGDGNADGGMNAAQFLSGKICPTAIFCYNDMTAIGALAALKKNNIRVPEDISLVGYDDIYFAQYVDPPLTTIRQPKDEMGQQAAQMLLELVDGKKVENVSLSGELIVRHSTQVIASKKSKGARR